MTAIEGYRHLTFETYCEHEAALHEFFDVVERAYDDAKDQMGFCLPEVYTSRGNTYDLIILYPKEFPDREPHGWVEPAPDRPVAHMYGDGSLCVHDTRFDRDRWTPVVGFNLMRVWLELYEDFLFDGRPFSGSQIPADAIRRVEAMR